MYNRPLRPAILNNNHCCWKMKLNIDKALHHTLLTQGFKHSGLGNAELEECIYMARMYAATENAIAVLSDLRENKSYIYYGGMATQLGLAAAGTYTEIDSIWEEEILSKIHPDDLAEKYAIELQYFQLLRQLPNTARNNYFVNDDMRMTDASGRYITIRHRIFYVRSTADGSLWLTLCLYNLCYDEGFKRCIVNTATGEVVDRVQDKEGILSQREREVLRLIRQGKLSKEIADALFLSVNTVNRHRQNILHKLMVDNSMEACRVAELMKLI